MLFYNISTSTFRCRIINSKPNKWLQWSRLFTRASHNLHGSVSLNWYSKNFIHCNLLSSYFRRLPHDEQLTDEYAGEKTIGDKQIPMYARRSMEHFENWNTKPRRHCTLYATNSIYQSRYHGNRVWYRINDNTRQLLNGNTPNQMYEEIQTWTFPVYTCMCQNFQQLTH